MDSPAYDAILRSLVQMMAKQDVINDDMRACMAQQTVRHATMQACMLRVETTLGRVETTLASVDTTLQAATRALERRLPRQTNGHTTLEEAAAWIPNPPAPPATCAAT
jgi:hypothetical protein